MFKKKKQQIRLELTYPAHNRTILWAVITTNHPAGKWLKIMEYIESVPPDPDPNLISWKNCDGASVNHE